MLAAARCSRSRPCRRVRIARARTWRKRRSRRNCSPKRASYSAAGSAEELAASAGPSVMTRRAAAPGQERPAAALTAPPERTSTQLYAFTQQPQDAGEPSCVSVRPPSLLTMTEHAIGERSRNLLSSILASEISAPCRTTQFVDDAHHGRCYAWQPSADRRCSAECPLMPP